MAAYYPAAPTAEEQAKMRTLLHLFTDFYPCADCRQDFQVQPAPRAASAILHGPI